LEIGCGTGYGTAYLSEIGFSFIVASDIDKEVLYFINNKYPFKFFLIACDGTGMPFKENQFDAVIPFQVIEHLTPKDVINYLSEIKRVLTKNGLFICTTPNKRLRLLPFQKPWNPEHKKEYNEKELKKLLSKVFGHINIYGLCSSKEILEIERQRVKQDPTKVYIMDPLSKIYPFRLCYKLLKKMFTNQIFLKNKKNNRQESFIQEIEPKKLSVRNFFLDPTCPKNSLDWFVVCKNL